MGWWSRRRQERELHRAAFEGRIDTFGDFGRGTVGGADLTPDGINETAKALFHQGRRDEALRLWRGLAESGDLTGMANLVIECAADGDQDEALEWWRKAVREGLDIPAHDPGLKLRTTGRDRAAEGWWRAAGERLKDDRSCEYLGISLRERGEEEEAALALRPAAERGDPACARELAALALARADRETDPARRRLAAAEGLKWARKAAAGGDERSRAMLADLEQGPT
ncbi:hypothetical protein [Actinomadura yumaensis]|uniref:Sel1 repeat family protein n=2 Tax=Actinomadura TaxID=1988 RepID=A0ABW2CLJ4_9ACTN